MPLGSATGILDVTNATLRSKKLVATEDITTADLNVSGTFSVSGNTAALMMSEIQSNTQTMIDFTDSNQLIKFPREVLTSASQNGHVVSTPVANSTAWKAFNEIEYADNDRWFSTYVAGEADRYSLSTGYFASGTYDYTLSNSSGTPNGDYLSIQFPQAFVLHSFAFSTRSFSNLTDVFVIGEAPRDFQVWGSNDGSAWTKVFEIEDAPPPSGMGDVRTFHTSGITTAYNRYALIVTRNGSTYPRGQGRQIVTIGELRFYGYQQYASPRPGQDIVFKHHANVPTKDFLQVYWDANESNSYPGSGADVTDIATASSNTVPGALSGSVAFDTTSNAWTFDGNADFIEGTLPSSFAGDQPHTAAFWFKRASNHNGTLFTVSPSAGEASQQSKVIQVRTNDSAGYSLSYIFWSNDIRYNPTLVDDTWYHLTATYAGGGGTPTKKLLYLNGALLNPVATSGSVIGNALAVDASSKMRIGARINHSSMNYLNGAVASFRLYTRPLIKEQVETLYDYEKVRFGHVSSLDVTLHKGSLGVGVAEPSRDDRLAVAGRANFTDVKTSRVVDRNDVVVYEQSGPHDRPLTKYPEVAMTANSSGGYVASASTTYNNNGSVYIAFNEDGGTTSWISQDGAFDTSSPYGANSTASTFDGVQCEWIQLQLPRAVKVSYFKIIPRSTAGGTNAAPEDQTKSGSLYGSNDGSAFTKIMDYGDLDYGGASGQVTQTVTVNASVHYKYLRLTCTARYGNFNNQDWVSIGELELYGTEEGDASTDSKLTSVLNKPGTQQLEVYWDGADSNSYPGAGTEVFDLSGNGVKGTITGTNGFDSTTYNAWTFDGSGDYISTTNSGLGTGGAFDHSFAFWFKINRNITNNDYVVTFGEEANDNMIAVNISGNSLIHFDNWGRGVITGDVVRLGIWYHVACTHTGSATGDINTQLIYVNGIRQTTGSTGTGTLAFTSDRITVGARPGTDNSNTPAAFLDGAVANVRFFKGKVLNAEQVKELYAYDAVRFGHRASNSVSVHKGNLGVGVTQPTSRFEVAGADGLFEYPPRAMDGFETYMAGHGVFRVSASGNASSSYPPSRAFNKNSDYNDRWQIENVGYDETTGLYGGSNVLSSSSGTPSGEYLILSCPSKVCLRHYSVTPRNNSTYYDNQAPVDAEVWGSEDDGSSWTFLHRFIGVSYASQTDTKHYTVSTDKYYSSFALITTRNGGGSTAFEGISIGEWRLFGTPAPSSLEDGHLTLGKTLTTPRVSGHAAGAETPRAESLVLHYDTTVDSIKSESTVVDTSGSGNNGTFNGNAAYSSSDRALTFDGTGDYIVKTSALGLPTGDAIFSVSAWIKVLPVASWPSGVQWPNIITYGSAWAGSKIGGFFVTTNLELAGTVGSSTAKTASGVITPNTWQHVVAVKSGTGQISTTTYELYVDGVKLPVTGVSGNNTLSIGSGVSVSIGGGFTGVASDMFTGKISNPKMWNVALTADDVAADYALGRTGKVINVTDTAVCLGVSGGVPRAQLDVRGGARFDGYVGIGPVEEHSSSSMVAPMLDVRSEGDTFVRIATDGSGSSGLVLTESTDNQFIMEYEGAGGGAGNYVTFHTNVSSWTGGAKGQGFNYVPNNGRVGLGITSPKVPLHIKQKGSGYPSSGGNSNGSIRMERDANTNRWDIYTYSNNNLHFDYNNNGKAYVDEDLSGYVQMNFTGQHRTFIKDVPFTEAGDLEGLIVSADQNKYIKMSGGVEAGSNAITTNESLPVVSLSNVATDKTCFGVISASEDPETREEAFGNFVSISEKELGDTRVYINSVGEGAVWVTNANGNLESGDYITTSNVAGYGMKQDSEFLANYTVAKITMDCDFEPATQPVQQIVKELSNVNYWVETTYTDVALEEYSNLAEENRRTVTATRYSNGDGDISPSEYSNLESNAQATYSEIETTTYQKIDRVESTDEQEGYELEVREELVNVLDEHGQLQWEDDPSGATEKAYKIRYLTADGEVTDESNAVHVAAFVGCTYHSG